MKPNALRYVLLAALLLTASCGAVTETGNPKQPVGSEPYVQPETDDQATSDAGTYTNESFGVEIAIPDGWETAEAADGSSVDFIGSDSSATVTFEIIEPQPASLFAYLFETYPGRTFSLVITPTMSGYLYDDPNPGPNGGDLREYFFLDGDLLIHVDAEVFAATEDAFMAIIRSITVTE